MIATEPVETIHLYYEQDEPPRPRANFDVGIALFSLICFGLLVWGICSIPPTLETVIVPAHLLPLKRFSATIFILPTGVKTYPATTATGMLTIYNGSFLSESIPQGLILISRNGVEVTTDASVIVPAANPPAYGMATVAAHALVSGNKGNIAAYHIASVENSSIYIRNLTPFRGGRDAYSIVYTTMQDRQKALETARANVSRLVSQNRLDGPCSESVRKKRITWVCQSVTYTPPIFFHVVGVEVRGKQVVVYGYAVAHPQSIVRK